MANIEDNTKKKPTLVSEMREFLLDSTFVEWALGWIAGEVISRFLTSLVHDTLFPFISGVFFDGARLEDVAADINGSTVYWGTMLVNAIDMIVVLFVLFLVCQVICIMRKRHKLEEEDSNEQLIEIAMTNTEILSDIKDMMAREKKQD